LKCIVKAGNKKKSFWGVEDVPDNCIRPLEDYFKQLEEFD
jgi:hypothetical protein